MQSEVKNSIKGKNVIKEERREESEDEELL